MLASIGIIIVLIFLFLMYKHYTVGRPYEVFLIHIQTSLLEDKFPNLDITDIHQFMKTSTCNSIRVIMKNHYYQYFTRKDYDSLKEIMDKAMVRGLVYVQIESWLKNMQTKEEAWYFLHHNDIYEGLSSLNPRDWE